MHEFVLSNFMAQGMGFSGPVQSDSSFSPYDNSPAHRRSPTSFFDDEDVLSMSSTQPAEHKSTLNQCEATAGKQRSR